jgi:hypothetical protein
MNDDELRGLIRAAIQRHMSSSAPETARELRRDAAFGGDAAPPQPPPLSISFTQYRLERPADDTMCLIEPAVQCNHCGFCKCHGH